jgi:hypothetical protein
MNDYQIQNLRTLIADLRSGTHIQITSVLKRKFVDGSYGFCCLGRASELRGIPSQEQNYPAYSDGKIVGNNCMMNFGSTTDPMFDNLRESFPSYDWWLQEYGKIDYHNLAKMNDDGSSFEEIADYIEQEIMSLQINTPAEELENVEV